MTQDLDQILSTVEQRRIDRLEKSLEIAIDNRQFEIDMLWKRAGVFWGFIAALFIAVAALYKDGSNKGLVFVLCLIGVIFSLIWTLANRGSKSWQESWELKAEFYFEELYKYKSFYNRIVKKEERRGFGRSIWKFIRQQPARYSLSRLLIVLSDITLVFWVGASIYFGNKIGKWFDFLEVYKEYSVEVLGICAFIVCLYIAIFMRSSDKGEQKTILDLKSTEEQMDEQI